MGSPGVDQSCNEGILVDGIGNSALFNNADKQVGRVYINNYYESKEVGALIPHDEAYYVSLLREKEAIIEAYVKLVERMEDKEALLERHCYEIEKENNRLKRGKKIFIIGDQVFYTELESVPDQNQISMFNN